MHPHKAFTCILLLLAGALARTQPTSPEDAVRLAWESRNAIRAAERLIAEAKLSRIGASSFPTTTLHLGRGTDRVPGDTDSDLSISQPIDFFGRGKAAAGAADGRVQLAEVRLKEAKLHVQSEVLRSLNEVVAASRRLVVAQDLLKVTERLKNAAKRKVELGESPEIQLLRAELEWGNAVVNAQAREFELQAFQEKLNGAVGVEAPLLPSSFFESSVPQDLAVDKTLPSLLAIALEIGQAESDVRVLRAAGRPDVSLELRRSPWAEEAQGGLRLQVSMPLFDSGRAKGQIQAAQKRKESLELLLLDAYKTAQAQIKSLRTELQASEIQVRQLKELLQKAREITAISQKGFDTGALTLVETLEATRALKEAEERLVEAELQRAQRSASLTAAAGVLLEVKP